MNSLSSALSRRPRSALPAVSPPPVSPALAQDDFPLDDLDPAAIRELELKESELLASLSPADPIVSCASNSNRDSLQNQASHPQHINHIQIFRQNDISNHADLYYAKREIDKLNRELATIRSSNHQLESDALVKNGEIAMIRKNLSKLNSENTELKDKLTKQMLMAQQSKLALRSQLQREIDRLVTELKFKDQELSAAHASRRPKSISSPAFKPAANASPLKQMQSFPTIASFNEPLATKPSPLRHHSLQRIQSQRPSQPLVASIATNTDPIQDPPPKLIKTTVVVSPNPNLIASADITRIAIGKSIIANQSILLDWTARQNHSAIFDAFLTAAQHAIADPSTHTTPLLQPIAQLLLLAISDNQDDAIPPLLQILALVTSHALSASATSIDALEKINLFQTLSTIFQLIGTTDPPEWIHQSNLDRTRVHLLHTIVVVGAYGGDDTPAKLDSIVSCAGLAVLCLPGTNQDVTILALQVCCVMAKMSVFVEEMSATLVHTNIIASDTIAGNNPLAADQPADYLSAIDYICRLLIPTTALSEDLAHAALTFCYVALESNHKSSRILSQSHNLLAFVTYVHSLATQLEQCIDPSSLDQPHESLASSLDPSHPFNHVHDRLVTAVRFINRLFSIGDIHFGTTHSGYLLVTSMAKISRWPCYGSVLADMAKELLFHVIETPDASVAEIWPPMHPVSAADASYTATNTSLHLHAMTNNSVINTSSCL